MAGERKRQKKNLDYSEESDFDPVADDSNPNPGVDDSDFDPDVDSDEEFVPTRKMKVKKQSKEPKPSSKATVTLLAMGDADVETQSLENVDQATLERVKKALNLSRHPGTAEHEAHQALRLAMKLMESLNVTQAQVLESMEGKDDRLKQAGHSVVTVSCEQNKNMYIQSWASTASSAVSMIFDIKFYTQSHWQKKNEIRYVFYGLAPNTVSAAHAYEMVYNLILRWRMANKEAKGMNAKNAYCRGVANGLYDFAKKERKREEKEAREAETKRLEAQQKTEEEQRKREIERLEIEPKLDLKARVEDDVESTYDNAKPSKHILDTLPDPAECEADEDDYFGWDDSDDYGDYSGDENMDLQTGLDTEEARAEDAVAPDIDIQDEAHDIDLDELQEKSNERLQKKEDQKKEEDQKKKDEVVNKIEAEDRDPAWQSAGALIAFRKTSILLADDYLKRRGTKLRSSRKLPKLQLKGMNASQSYHKGLEDSKKIDLKRKRIKAADEED
ncbi:hypothetical protein FB446DRAFT_717948 [Lentinula raphanica]|nr:hypothetical protein FB446DRAFT_717948 [Lentinula raphanica]